MSKKVVADLRGLMGATTKVGCRITCLVSNGFVRVCNIQVVCMFIVATKHGIACVVDMIAVFRVSRLLYGTMQS
jgi:hypothetical protein